MAVIIAFLGALTPFVVAIVPVITDQVSSITDNAPHWLDEPAAQQAGAGPQRGVRGRRQGPRSTSPDGDFAGAVFGGALGVGLAVLGALFNAFIILVLTPYFLSSMKTTTHAFYSLVSRAAATGSPGRAIG